MTDLLSREIRHITSPYGDQVELEILHYIDFYHVIATICQDHPPFKDYIAFGHDTYSETIAIEKALHELYSQNLLN